MSLPSEAKPISTRRGFVAATGVSFALAASGCLGTFDDDGGSDDASESYLSLSNHGDSDHEVEVEVHDVSNDERLVDERLTVAPDDDLERFYFTTDPDENGNFPRVRGEVQMVDDPENADSETRAFPPSAGANFAAVIRDYGQIEMYVDQV